MTCRLCTERGKTWDGDDPKCAFPDGVFSTDNWNCATMQALIDVVEHYVEMGPSDQQRANFYYRDDTWFFWLAYDTGWIDWPEDEDGMAGWITMLRYKHRGAVEQASVMELGEPMHLTLRQAEAAIACGRFDDASSEPKKPFVSIISIGEPCDHKKSYGRSEHLLLSGDGTTLPYVTCGKCQGVVSE